MPLDRRLEAAGIASFLLLGLALTTSAYAAAPAASGTADHRILVTAVDGDVDVMMAHVDVEPRVGDELLLPSRIVTGDDGTLSLEQARTTISIAPNSDIEIPETAYDGQLIGRLVQWRGNVFYDVETREVERLRVETPYLVAVVKGTQFNVAVLDDTTTISLFEGRLEIRDPEGRNVVDLEAGEVAIRSRDDATIRVIDMSAASLPTVDGDGSLVAAVSDRRDGDDELNADGLSATADADGLRLDGGSIRGSDDLGLRADASLVADAGLGDPGMLAAVDGRGVDTALGSIGIDASLDAGADLGPTNVDLGATADLNGAALSADLGLDATLGDASLGADLDAGLDLGNATADLGLDAGADLGAASLGADLNAGLDLGNATADLGLDARADLGGASLGADLDAGLDLGAGTVDVGLGAAAGLGDTALDADLDAGLDLGAGTADLGLDAVASIPDVGLDAGADVGVSGDIIGGSLDAGLGEDVGLGDVGLGGDLAASIDVGDGGLAGSLDTGLDLGGTGLDAGLDAGADLTGGELDAGLDVGGLVDAGVDAGLDLSGEDAGLGADVTLPGGIDASIDVDLGGGNDEGGLLGIIDVDLGGGRGGLLGGLL